MSNLYNKQDPEGTHVDFHRDLARLLNRHGIDAVLGTPDHVLATMVVKQLDVYGETVATTKRLAKGGPFQPFEHMSYDAIMTDADKFGRAHEDQALVNMDRALDSEYPSNKIDPDAKC
jgi:hypothetical protein